MAQDRPELFAIDPGFIQLVRGGSWVAAGAALVLLGIGAVMLLWPDVAGEAPKPNAAHWLALLSVAFLFAAGAWYLRRFVRTLPLHGVIVDGDGLWPAHKPREKAVVRWETIRRIRELQTRQRLELLDGQD